jgi:hypothetical protein
MRRSAGVVLALFLLGAPAHARKVPPRKNVVGISLIIGGALIAGVGAVLLGRGYALTAGPGCPAWPQTSDVCGGLAGDYRAGGAALLAIGGATAVAGGVTVGVMAR